MSSLLIYLFLILPPGSFSGTYPEKVNQVDFEVGVEGQEGYVAALFGAAYRRYFDHYFLGVKLSTGIATEKLSGEQTENRIIKVSTFGGPHYTINHHLAITLALTAGYTTLLKNDHQHYFNGGVMIDLQLRLNHHLSTYLSLEGGTALLSGDLNDNQKIFNPTLGFYWGISLLF